jgi:hypothetical protein
MSVFIALLMLGTVQPDVPPASAARAAEGELAHPLAVLPHLRVVAGPKAVRAFDTPSDGGGSITITWEASPERDVEFYEVARALAPGPGKEPEFKPLTRVPGTERSATDPETDNRLKYVYRVTALRGPDQGYADSNIAQSKPQLFNLNLLNTLIGMAIVFFLILYFIYHARKGRELFIRRIAGLDAVEESVGRATEMGKPILYTPGIGGMAQISTIASMNILGEIAKKTAQYNTTLIVPNSDPIVYTVAREMVKEAHASVGRPDTFKPDNVFFITQEQFAYAAAVDGIMVRDKPATIFLIGWFAAEALILAETGATTGAIQIAGTDAIYQLPFFITACDYTLIGEELYAASAYLSREPLLLGSLVGQDYGKLVILVVLLVATALYLLSAVKGLEGLGAIRNFFNI